jgi:GMP synthase-like glutamine amidotransferase
MHVHWLQHAACEDLGTIAPWLASHGHEVTATRLFADEAPPPVGAFDALIVMGGPMNIYEHERHPWLVAEKQLIRAALDDGKRLLGICLGAQLIADQLGGPVMRNAEPEIGWFPVTPTEAGRRSGLFRAEHSSLPTFHWHGDTYALPRGAERLAFSAVCAQQAFSYDGWRVVGLQFHPEATTAGLTEWLRNERLPQAPYVQSTQEILERSDAFAMNREFLSGLLARVLG